MSRPRRIRAGVNEALALGSADFRLRAGAAAARLHRRRLDGVTFVGVTGSAGKTTTKEMVASVLADTARVRRSPADANGMSVIAKTILRTTRRDDYCVVEVAAGWGIGGVARSSALLRPNVGVVTTVGRDHHKLFRSLAATAEEKRGLIASLPADGTAVLNADDANVLGMADGFAGRVITYGESPGAALRAQDVESRWPEPLRFTLSVDGLAIPVRTRLQGRHWVTSVLAAIAVARAVGIEIPRAAAAAAAVDPVPHRMQPVRVGGVTFIDDAQKAPLWTLGSTFEFIASANAARRILVIGTISDYAHSSSTVYRQVAERALDAADEVIFVGPNARQARRSASPRAANHLYLFPELSGAVDHLRAHARDGDLIVLKGSHKTDRLERIMGMM